MDTRSLAARYAGWLALSLAVGIAPACAEDRAGPVEVGPATEDSAPDPAPTADGEPTPGATTGAAIWLVDAGDHPVAVLVRRGSDDSVAGRAIYDLVTAFHPASGLFFEITLSDGVVRYPGDTFFTGPHCDKPVGVSVGACLECRSGPGVGFLHNGSWWRIEPAMLYEQTPNGSMLGSGLGTQCVAHGTTNTKAYPVELVAGLTPPTEFAAPLTLAWR